MWHIRGALLYLCGTESSRCVVLRFGRANDAAHLRTPWLLSPTCASYQSLDMFKAQGATCRHEVRLVVCRRV